MQLKLIFLLATVLVSPAVLAQLSTQVVSSRVSPDEPMGGGDSAMPVGLISDMMVVGNWNHSSDFLNGGAVWSFKWNGSDWVQVQKITPPGAAANMAFGWSLAVEEQVDTGEAWLVVGAPWTDNNVGAVHLYQRDGDSWVYKQTLSTPGRDFYGFDVDINVDIPIGMEDYQWDLAVGAPSHKFESNPSNTGTVFASSLNSLGLWTQGAIPLGADALTGVNPQYGRSVALDGDVIIAGAPSARVDGNNGAGAVAIFTRGQFSPWAGNTPVLNPDPLTNEINGAGFGTDVDVVKQVTFPRQPTGNYYYVISAPNPTSFNSGGTVYILEGGDFQTLTRPDNLQGNDRFGIAVRFREDLESGNHHLLAGTQGPNAGTSGAVYLYDQVDFNEPWLPHARFAISEPDQSPGSTARVCQSIAAWEALIAIAAPNGMGGKDAVYSNPVIIFSSGFEDP